MLYSCLETNSGSYFVFHLGVNIFSFWIKPVIMFLGWLTNFLLAVPSVYRHQSQRLEAMGKSTVPLFWIFALAKLKMHLHSFTLRRITARHLTSRYSCLLFISIFTWHRISEHPPQHSRFCAPRFFYDIPASWTLHIDSHFAIHIGPNSKAIVHFIHVFIPQNACPMCFRQKKQRVRLVHV